MLALRQRFPFARWAFYELLVGVAYAEILFIHGYSFFSMGGNAFVGPALVFAAGVLGILEIIEFLGRYKLAHYLLIGLKLIGFTLFLTILLQDASIGRTPEEDRWMLWNTEFDTPLSDDGSRIVKELNERGTVLTEEDLQVIHGLGDDAQAVMSYVDERINAVVDQVIPLSGDSAMMPLTLLDVRLLILVTGLYSMTLGLQLGGRNKLRAIEGLKALKRAPS